MDYSIMFFSSLATGDAREHYQLLKDAAQLADDRGLEGIWTPERHFDEFGGVFPNPAVTSAALAAVTNRIRLCAGSVVSPLHDVLLVAEDWSVVDNLSDGRVSISFGSGWNPDDFVFAPQVYPGRKQLMQEQIETFLKLWRGESVGRRNGADHPVDVRLSPRPVQQQPPIWISSGGSPDTFEFAGAAGFNVLTHAITQDRDVIADNIAAYRAAREKAGLDPVAGRITTMLHTFVGTDNNDARTLATPPLRTYLESAMRLEMRAASAREGSTDVYDEDYLEELIGMRLERYFTGYGLLGDADHCVEVAQTFADIGVDEIACLIDFGVDYEPTMQSLERLCDFANPITCA